MLLTFMLAELNNSQCRIRWTCSRISASNNRH